MSLDLHIHSIHSDGTFTPEEIVKRAQNRGLQGVAITDHDTFAGTEEAMVAADKFGIEAVSGIELSVEFETLHLHILGYLFDHTSEMFRKKILLLQDERKLRNEKIIWRLCKLGFKIDIQEVKKISPVGQIGRPHIAQLLCKKGVVRNINEAFQKYLKKGKEAYCSRFVYGAEEAINIIHESGGLAVLAHPFQLDPREMETNVVVGKLVNIGLDGLEAYYPTHSRKMRKQLFQLARKHNLVLTGGSDYHGSIRPGTDLAGSANMHVPLDILQQMKQKWHEAKNQSFSKNNN